MPERFPLDRLREYYKIDGIPHDEIVATLQEIFPDLQERSYDEISILYTDQLKVRLAQRLEMWTAALERDYPQLDVAVFTARCEKLLHYGRYYVSDSDFAALFSSHQKNESDDQFFALYLSLVAKNTPSTSGL